MTALSSRQHRTVILLLCVVAALLVSFALSHIPRELGMSAAHAQAAADVGSGSAAAAPADQLHDPVSSPGAAFDDLKALRKLGWPVLIFAGVLLLGRVAAHAQSIAWLAWLGRGRVAVVIAGAMAIAAAGYNTLAAGGTPMAALIAAGFALATFYNSHAQWAPPMAKSTT